ncbi:helix-turn-helix domain-containing protein [Desulfosarcina sp.]|nr:helix-turn-helix domain-containing protein [Desulfosarcina sp.]
MKTGILIKELRIKKGLTQEELADMTELSSRTIQRIENGEVDPRSYTLQMIAKALEVDFSLFVEKEPDENPDIQKTNDNIWLGLLHLSVLVPLIFPSVIIWNNNKNKVKGMTDHYRAVLSYQLIMIGVLLGSLWVYYKINLIIPFLGVLVANALFSIMNAVRVLNGDAFMYPTFSEKRKQKNK